MATIALPRVSSHTRSASPHPLNSILHLDNINTATTCPIPIPNKHLPVCPPGPAPTEKPQTPPQSPPSKEASLPPRSLLSPPDSYLRLSWGKYPIYEIDTAGVAAALDHLARQPLPDPSQVFPWFHGLHPSNHIQLAFFIARRRNLRKVPKCWRGITLVKAGGDLGHSRLKGALSPDEFLQQTATGAVFRDLDPKEGFSVRNFQIQAAKSASLSDILVYGDDEVEIRSLARDVASAQHAWRESHEEKGLELPRYNTFACLSPFHEFEESYPEIVSINSEGQMTGRVMDFFYQERLEMCTMTKASEIDHNVWLGPTPDPSVHSTFDSSDEPQFDILIECSDLGRMDPLALKAIATGSEDITDQQIYLEFPSSGSIIPPTWSHSEADGIVESCKWLYHIAHGTIPDPAEELDRQGDSPMPFTSSPSPPPSRRSPRKILIHCTDGYTESTLLGLSYFTYATGLPVPTAWLDLHVNKQRNFFAYPSDVALLTSIAPRLLSESPVHADKSPGDVVALTANDPQWIKNIDGSLPSRITNYMYLGNLGHANNPDLLREMSILQILSVGETAAWKDGEMSEWGPENVMVVHRVQDNGVDPLAEEIERCLEFIGMFAPFSIIYPETSLTYRILLDRGRAKGVATLVHCRVGVSRSATICIAEVMRSLGLSFPRAYCFVRARRLNVIIQPHLRFSYELLKWEEKLRAGRSGNGQFKRELEWPDIAREVAAMNRPYAR